MKKTFKISARFISLGLLAGMVFFSGLLNKIGITSQKNNSAQESGLFSVVQPDLAHADAPGGNDPGNPGSSAGGCGSSDSCSDGSSSSGDGGDGE